MYLYYDLVAEILLLQRVSTTDPIITSKSNVLAILGSWSWLRFVATSALPKVALTG